MKRAARDWMEPSDDEDEDPLVARASVEALQPSDDEDDAPDAVAVGTKGTFLFENEFGKWYSVPGYPKEKLRGSDQGYVQVSRKCGGWGQPSRGYLRNNGYYSTCVDRKKIQVHDLLCTIWNGVKQHASQTAQHGKGGKGDNSRSNLIGWATKTEQRTEYVKTPAPRRDGKPIIVWKVGEDKVTASEYRSAAHAKEMTGAPALYQVANGDIRQSGGYYAVWAQSEETQTDLKGEEWREVCSTCWVSNMGRHWRKNATGEIWKHKYTPKPTERSVYVKITIEGVQRPLHVVVYDAFKNDRNGLSIDHVNQDETDNRLINLRPATAKEQRANQSRKAARYSHLSLKTAVRGKPVTEVTWQDFESLTAAAKHVEMITNKRTSSAHVSRAASTAGTTCGWQFEYITSLQAGEAHQRGLVVSDLKEHKEEED